MQVFTSDVSTVNALRRADGGLEALAWQDPLTFGRLSLGRDLDAFAEARSLAYASGCWDEDAVVQDDLKLRNAELASAFDSQEEVHLFFGASLRDQLHLAQILAWLSERPASEQARARLMQVDGPLLGFEETALLRVAKAAEAISPDARAAYVAAWDAITAEEPSGIESALQRARAEGLGALSAGLMRWLQELPSSENGLSITQLQTLDAVRLGVQSPRALFAAVQATEEIPFRVDWEFWAVLDGLCSGSDPLLRSGLDGQFLCPPRDLAFEAFDAQRLDLTERGHSLLSGSGNYTSGSFAERWLGGLKLDAASAYFWDYAGRRIVDLASAARA